MGAVVSFILKVLAVSVGVAIAIKLAPSVSTPSSTALVLAIVCFPSVIMAIVLGWDAIKKSSKQPTSL
jgi:hypothetical protein